MQALLTGQQFVDIHRLVFAQRLGHQAEAARQQVDFHGRGNRQSHVIVALADVVGSLGQRFDRCAEAPSNALRRDKTDDQHRQPDQAKQPGYQQGAFASGMLHLIDTVQRVLVLSNQPITQNIEALAEIHAGAGVLRCFGSHVE